MTHPVRSVLRRRSRVLLAGAATAALSAALLPTIPASSAEESPNCPQAYPVADLVKGAPVHGLTVSTGTTPDPFTGEVVGVIDDGIAPGLDLIMVKLSGSVITDQTGQADRGIWAGMSGSPVYADDGRLIGAVSYGLSYSPSEYAGVTPASAMYDIGRYDGLPIQGARTAQTTPRAVSQLQAAGLRASEAREGFARLPMPTSVSGLAPNRFGPVARRLGLNGRALVSGGSAQAGEPAGDIVPGGNIAMALSYGDVTYAGIGTATAVCDDAVLAFGHPFSFTGRTIASMHSADAIFVQRDTTFGSYKVANPTGPVGSFTQDRMAGILGRLGTMPQTAPVTTTVATTEGNHRTGTTYIVDPRMSADLAAIHLLTNLDTTYNGIRGGTGTLAWTISVRRADGTVLTLDRSDIYSSNRDVTFEMPWDFYGQLSSILDNGSEKVDLVSVEQKARLNTAFRQHRLGALQVRRQHQWMTPPKRALLRVNRGSTMLLRVRLVPAPDSNVAPQWVRFHVDVPQSARGIGRVLVHGGQGGFGFGFFGFSSSNAKSLPKLIDELETAPTNNSVSAVLQIRTRGGAKRVEQRVERLAPIAGRKSLTISVRR